MAAAVHAPDAQVLELATQAADAGYCDGITPHMLEQERHREWGVNEWMELVANMSIEGGASSHDRQTWEKFLTRASANQDRVNRKVKGCWFRFRHNIFVIAVMPALLCFAVVGVKTACIAYNRDGSAGSDSQFGSGNPQWLLATFRVAAFWCL
jgi:hypothetical protein